MHVDSPTRTHVHLGALMHYHKCGASPVPELAQMGCGHVWGHESGSHMCPKCGKGPWLMKVDPQGRSREWKQLSLF